MAKARRGHGAPDVLPVELSLFRDEVERVLETNVRQTRVVPRPTRRKVTWDLREVVVPLPLNAVKNSPVSCHG